MGSSDGSIEEELRREIAFRRAIEESMLAGVCAVDRGGVQTYVNAAFARMLGWSADELVGARPPYAYWPPEELASIEAAFRATLSGSAHEGGVELRFRRKNEERFDALVLISALRDGEDEPRGWLASVYDITERKRTEQRLRLEQERLHLTMEAGRLGAWEWHIDTGRVSWSRELEALHGIAPGSFAGTFEAFQADIHPEDRERVLDLIRATIAENRSEYRVEYRIVPPDGLTRWLEARGRVVTDGPGPRLIGVCSDVTDRKTAEETQRLLADAAERARVEAERAAARLRVLAEASAALASSLDEDTALRELARVAVAHLADYAVTYAIEPDQRIRRVGLAHRDPSRQPLVEELVRAGPPRLSDAYGVGAVMRTGESVFAGEIQPGLLERAAQNEAHLEVLRELQPRSSIVVPLVARGRTVGGLALAATDGSGRRYVPDDVVLAEELAGRAALLVDNARLFREAQEAARAREDMVAAVSHDLRNPLQVIKSSTTLLAMPELPADRHGRAVAATGRAVAQMERFVSELLDAARIDAGSLSMERVVLDLRELAVESVAVLAPLAEEKSVRVEVVHDERPARVLGDPMRLRQVLANVVGNAVELVSSGGDVRVGVESDAREVRVAVTDTGPGIPDAQLPFLFQRFWQGDRSGRRGTGLGLAIAKGIVDAHGGAIRVQSRVGEGSTFVIALPAAEDG